MDFGDSVACLPQSLRFLGVLLTRLTDVATKLKKLVSDLSYTGSKRVMRGELSDVHLEGVVFAPTGRTSVPTVIVIPDWLTPVGAYHELARHLASWGMACVVPKLKNNGLNDAADMTEQVAALVQSLRGMQLGNGTAQFDSDKVALLGHGLGGAVAAETAAKGVPLKAVVAAYPTEATPSPLDFTARAAVPALVIAPEFPPLLSIDVSEDFANSWGASVVMRKVPGCTRMGMTGNSLLERFGLSETNDKKPLRAQTALMTGYLWYQLTGEKDFKGFAALDSEIAGTEVVLTEQQEDEAAAPNQSKCPFARLVR